MSSAPTDNRILATQPGATASGWSALPPEYAIPDVAPSLAEAQQYCVRLATSHYENFPVVTWFLPKHLHQHFYNVYAYCRISDDLGDEVGDKQQSLCCWTSGKRNWCSAIAESRASGVCCAARNRAAVRHSAARVLRSAAGVPARPDRDPLSALHRSARLLPVLGESRGPPRAVPVRLSRCRTPEAF